MSTLMLASTSLIAQIQYADLAQYLRVGVTNRFGYSTFLITWLREDGQVIWQLQTNSKIFKNKEQLLQMYVSGMIDCYLWAHKEENDDKQKTR